MKAQNKTKLVIGYTSYIMDEDVAITLFKALNGANIEKLESIHNSDTKTTLYFVKSLDKGLATLESVSADDYAVWKLAGASIGESYA